MADIQGLVLHLEGCKYLRGTHIHGLIALAWSPEQVLEHGDDCRLVIIVGIVKDNPTFTFPIEVILLAIPDLLYNLGIELQIVYCLVPSDISIYHVCHLYAQVSAAKKNILPVSS